MSTVGCIVLAAGEGTRFGEPKQFEELLPGVRLVDASVATAVENCDQVVLVLPPGHDWSGDRVGQTVSGGTSRLESVAAGLGSMPGEVDVVVVHDAAHPLASGKLFSDVVAAIELGADGAVPFQPVADVVKKSEDDGSLTTVGRDGLGLAQMPMGFRHDALRQSHNAVRQGAVGYREDSMLLEAMGYEVVATPGESRNIHVVTRADLEHARVLAARAARH